MPNVAVCDHQSILPLGDGNQEGVDVEKGN